MVKKFKPSSFMKKVSGTKNWFSFRGDRKDFSRICSRNAPQKTIIIGEDIGSFKKSKSIRHVFGIGKSSKVINGKSQRDTLRKARNIVISYAKKHDKC